VSRAQYYEDKKLLDRLGFRFHFERRSRGFVIDQDRYLPTPDLALSERMALILAVRHLCSLGDSTLSHQAVEAARKLISGLDGSLPDAMAALFEDFTITEGYGCDAAVLEKLNQALSESRRIRMVYSKPSSSEPTVYEIDPYCLTVQHRSVYLEACIENKLPACTVGSLQARVRVDSLFNLIQNCWLRRTRKRRSAS
jgi:predicted DNA-binding transcriptional regulator YafY